MLCIQSALYYQNYIHFPSIRLQDILFKFPDTDNEAGRVDLRIGRIVSAEKVTYRFSFWNSQYPEAIQYNMLDSVFANCSIPMQTLYTLKKLTSEKNPVLGMWSLVLQDWSRWNL